MSPLSGRSIVVTRPARQAVGLAGLIEAAGGRALRYPAIEIEVAGGAALDATVKALGGFDLAIFVSRNAVEHGLRRVRAVGPWPSGVAIAAVGAGTRRALESEELCNVIAPAGPADSEALLAEPRLNAVAGERIVIFRGEGGRELLASGLRARGATVEYAECYRRTRPATDFGPLLGEWTRGAVDAVTVSSGEALANLVALLGKAGQRFLAASPLFVPHPRVGEEAHLLGLGPVQVAGPGDDEMLAALVAYFGRAG